MNPHLSDQTSIAPTSAATSGPANFPAGRVRWILIWAMLFISSTAFLDRVNISIAAVAMQRDFGLSNIQLGWVFSSFLIGYAVFQAPGGRLADRLGPRKTIALGALWWAVFTTLTASTPGHVSVALAILLLTRFLLGAGEAVMFPASNTLVARWIPSTERGLANGLIFAGVGVGSAIAPPLVTRILLAYGWRWSFWICAVIGILAGALWFYVARDKPDKHPWVKVAERDHILSGVSRNAVQGIPSVLPWRTILKSKDVWAMTVSYFCYGYAAYIYFTWFFLYLSTARGLNLKSSAYYGMLPFIAIATCSPLGGCVSDHLVRTHGNRTGRCGLAGLSMTVSAVFICASMGVNDARVAAIVLAGGAGALYLAQSMYWSVSADLAGPSSGSVSGVMNMGCQLGGALTALLTPVLADKFGWDFSFYAAAAVCAAGALTWCIVNPEAKLSRSPLTEQTSD